MSPRQVSGEAKIPVPSHTTFNGVLAELVNAGELDKDDVRTPLTHPRVLLLQQWRETGRGVAVYRKVLGTGQDERLSRKVAIVSVGGQVPNPPPRRTSLPPDEKVVWHLVCWCD